MKIMKIWWHFFFLVFKGILYVLNASHAYLVELAGGFQ